jgi:hypothetical protein
MLAKRGWLSVRRMLILAIAVAIIAASAACQQQGADGILFGFSGGGTTQAPATETLIQVSVSNTGASGDKLVLEKVEIYGASETPVKSFAVNMTLNSVSGKLRLLDVLQLLWRLFPFAYRMIGEKAADLAAEIRAESFSTGYFAVDLRQIRQPLTPGDIPIIAKVTLIHDGKRTTLEKEVMVEYTA